MRLSFGFVRGGHIACLYHGWQFDHEGQCRLIPAHPEVVVPKTIKATRYASVERLGMIWLHIQDGDDGQPPEDIARVTSVRTLAIEAPPELVATHLSPNARSPHDVTRQDVDGLPVIMVLQPLSTQETALHLVIHGQHGPDAQKRVAVWGMGLRARLEALAR
jgi:hypothetical protein